MKTGMRMLAVNNARRNRERMEGGGSMEMRGGRMEYGRMGGDEMRRGGGRMEMRGEEMRRGGGRMDGGSMEYGQNYGGMENRMGGERYAESGGRAEMRGGEPEARFRDRTGREHYDNGRYAPENYGGGNRGGELRYPYWPPIYEREEPEMNRIGFDMSGGRREVEYQADDEMGHRKGKNPERGKAEAKEVPPFDKETAQEWVESMHNEDGSTGPHWTMEQVKPIMQQRGVDAKPEEFWAIMNAMYSDFCKVAKKHNVSTVDFYADLTKAWLDDKDAVPDKAAAYYEYVVKHE